MRVVTDFSITNLLRFGPTRCGETLEAMDTIPHSKPTLDAGDFGAVSSVLSSGMLASGTKAHQAVEEIADWLGLAGGISTTSGASAILLALRALELPANSEVILPSYVCRSVYDAVCAAGFSPVLCDIEYDDWCMSVATITPCITNNTSAIIVVHPFGITSDVRSIRDLGFPIIEDCCQSLGSTFGGEYSGTVGDCGVFSFHATKLLTAGEGGMVLSNCSDFVSRLNDQSLTDHLCHKPLSDLQASLLLHQFSQYKSFLQRRKEIADTYFMRLRGIDSALPHSIRNRSIFFRFPLRTTRSFDKVQQDCLQKGIHVRKGVDTALHYLFPARGREYHNTERCLEETISIPIYPSLSDDDVQRIVEACLESLGYD